MATSSSTKARKESAKRRRVGVDVQRQFVLEAALEVFAERGVAEASVEHILLRAQVSRQTFYRCYRNKNELLEAVHHHVTGTLLTAIDAMRAVDLPPMQTLDHHLRLLFEHAAASGPVVNELEREAMGPTSAFREFRSGRHRVAEAFIREWVRQHFGVEASQPLVRAMIHSLDQLWLNVAACSGQPREVQQHALTSARALTEALLLHSGVPREVVFDDAAP